MPSAQERSLLPVTLNSQTLQLQVHGPACQEHAVSNPKPCNLRSTDLRAKSVYHTNVMMAIGTGVAIVCAESVADSQERQRLLSSLGRTHEVVQISLKQMDSLCGNALELEDGRGLPVMAMSTQV